MIGDIMTVSRLRMGTDGNGVSTLVTFFDCPLHCKYCINDICHEIEYGEVPRAVYTPEELIRTLEKDDIYYRMSGGGVVFGGGEPLLQSAFIHEVCQIMPSGWKRGIETSLNVSWHYVEPIISDIDEWIIDIKDMNREIYKKYTGKDNENVINNMIRLRKLIDKSKFRIRVPKIPGFNDNDNINNSVERVRNLLHVEAESFDYMVIPEIR